MWYHVATILSAWAQWNTGKQQWMIPWISENALEENTDRVLYDATLVPVCNIMRLCVHAWQQVTMQQKVKSEQPVDPGDILKGHNLTEFTMF